MWKQKAECFSASKAQNPIQNKFRLSMEYPGKKRSFQNKPSCLLPGWAFNNFPASRHPVWFCVRYQTDDAAAHKPKTALAVFFPYWWCYARYMPEPKSRNFPPLFYGNPNCLSSVPFLQARSQIQYRWADLYRNASPSLYLRQRVCSSKWPVSNSPSKALCGNKGSFRKAVSYQKPPDKGRDP